jgi:6-phosphogluconolactonase
MREVFVGESGAPSIDLVLLGVGEDGHTCSLFPGHALLNERGVWVAAIRDSPKPPPERITFTWPVLEAARHTAFVCTGAVKAAVVHNILREGNSAQYPAGMVRPAAGDASVAWFLDGPAAAQLQ